MDSYVQAWKRAFDFSGRSRRREFWTFMALNVLVAGVLTTLDAMLGFGGLSTVTGPGYGYAYVQPGLLTTLFGVLSFLPSLSVGIRRLHDTDRSGFWWFIGLVPVVGSIVLVVFWALDGTRGANRFGADPKSAEVVNA